MKLPIYVITMLKVKKKKERKELENQDPRHLLGHLPSSKLHSILTSFFFSLISLYANSIVAKFIIES